MAFTVETGAGVINANSFGAVADCDTYHSDRGNSLWTGTSAVKQAALIKATEYIEQVYGELWKGEAVNLEDGYLSWPRYDVNYLESDEIPRQLKEATYRLALVALSEDLNPALERGGMIKREKVDVIETEYMDGAAGTTRRPDIDGLLGPLLKNSPSSFNARAVRV